MLLIHQRSQNRYCSQCYRHENRRPLFLNPTSNSLNWNSHEERSKAFVSVSSIVGCPLYYGHYMLFLFFRYYFSIRCDRTFRWSNKSNFNRESFPSLTSWTSSDVQGKRWLTRTARSQHDSSRGVQQHQEFSNFHSTAQSLYHRLAVTTSFSK